MCQRRIHIDNESKESNLRSFIYVFEIYNEMDMNNAWHLNSEKCRPGLKLSLDIPNDLLYGFRWH